MGGNVPMSRIYVIKEIARDGPEIDCQVPPRINADMLHVEHDILRIKKLYTCIYNEGHFMYRHDNDVHV